MSALLPPPFGDDLPKTLPRDDRLGVAPLAKRLAQFIFKLEAPNGYVIGLHGEWGSGKSTLINFVVEYLNSKYNEEADSQSEKVEVIDFRPWMIAGHQDVMAAFVKVLSEAFGPRENIGQRFFRKTIKTIDGSTNAIVDGAVKLAIAVDKTMSNGLVTSIAGLAKTSVAKLTKQYLEAPSLQAAHDALASQLGKSKRRFLVTIDDIDRLSQDEMLTIMQMVKTVGRFPNVVYLLSYDRDKLWAALDVQDVGDGAGYAEKIVQQEIELPIPSRRALLSVLDKEISFAVGASPDDARWFTIVSDGINRWLTKPRDVIRFSNAMKFSWPALEGEIDPPDLLAMEGLRLFEPGAFRWIRENRDFLFREGRFQFADDETRKASVEELASALPEKSRKQSLKLIATLFPATSEPNSSAGEPYANTVTRRGIATKAGYEAYFSLNLSSDAISKRFIDDMLSGTFDEAKMRNAIAGFVGKRHSRGDSMVSELLEELRYRYDAAAPPNEVTRILLNALFPAGESILREPSSTNMFSLAPTSHLVALVRRQLEVVEADLAGLYLRDAFELCHSAVFCAEIYVDRGRELGVFGGGRSKPPVIREPTFKVLGKMLYPKILRAARNGTLREAPHFWNVMRAWQQLGDPKAARRWLNRQMLSSFDVTCRVAQGLVGVSHSPRGTSYVFTETPDANVYDLDNIWTAASQHLSGDAVDNDQRNLLLAVIQGIEEYRSSQTSATKT